MVVYATCSSSGKLSRISRTEQVPSLQNCSRMRVSAFEKRVLFISPTDRGNATTTCGFRQGGRRSGIVGMQEIHLSGKKRHVRCRSLPSCLAFCLGFAVLTIQPTF